MPVTSLEITSTLVFSRDDPCQTEISLDGRVLYTVQTTRTNGKSATDGLSVTTNVYDEAQQLVASLEWKDVVSDVVTLRSQVSERMALSKWLKKSILPFNHSATFKDRLERSYKWDEKGLRSQYRLLAKDVSKSDPIAYFERAQPYGTTQNPAPTPSMLHLTRRAEEILEDVVLTFLFMEKERRKEDFLTAKRADTRMYSST